MMNSNFKEAHSLNFRSPHNTKKNRDQNDDGKGFLSSYVRNVNSYSTNNKNFSKRVTPSDAPMFFNELKNRTRKKNKRKDCEGYNVEQRNCNIFDCNGMLFI